MTFSGRGFGGVAEVAETQVLEARLACEGRLWMNHHEIHCLSSIIMIMRHAIVTDCSNMHDTLLLILM